MKSLVEQIRTHSIWVVLGVYLAVSWVVLRIVDATSSNLGLPTWIFPFALGLLMVGLPIILTTWIIQSHAAGSHEGSPERTYRPGSDSAHMQRLFTWRNVLVGGLGGFLALVVGSASWVISARESGLHPPSAGANAGPSRPPGEGAGALVGAESALKGVAGEANEAVRSLARAIRAMDVQSTLAMYDDQPGFTYAFGSELVQGRAAFDDRVREGFAALRRIDEWEIDRLLATAIDAENVMVVARFREVAIDTLGAAEELVGVQTNHLVKRPGGWKISSGQTAAERVSKPGS